MKKRKEKGVTLLETMLCIMIMGALSIIIGQIVIQYRKSIKSVESYNQYLDEKIRVIGMLNIVTMNLSTNVYSIISHGEGWCIYLDETGILKYENSCIENLVTKDRCDLKFIQHINFYIEDKIITFVLECFLGEEEVIFQWN